MLTLPGAIASVKNARASAWLNNLKVHNRTRHCSGLRSGLTIRFVSMMFIAMVWPLAFFKQYPVKEFFLYLSTVMLLYSFVLYCVRFYKIVRVN